MFCAHALQMYTFSGIDFIFNDYYQMEETIKFITKNDKKIRTKSSS